VSKSIDAAYVRTTSLLHFCLSSPYLRLESERDGHDDVAGRRGVKRLRGFAAVLGLGVSACAQHPAAPAITACSAKGHWVDGFSATPVPEPMVRAAQGGVVLLGEEHDRMEDHRWEAASLAYFAHMRPRLVLGLEMFPRSKQAALDRFVAGGVSEADFLQQTDWAHVWGFDPALYMPIFRFARDHGIRMLALNVDGALVHRVAKAGWADVPASAREGVGDPAPPAAAYRAGLEQEMQGHAGMHMSKAGLQHFIDAQLLWDRAMAERIATQRAAQPGRLVVAMMGEGHLEHRNGVPAQLAALGVADAAVLLPTDDFCGPAPAE
jgi:uncharacterized iron-regulated protein